MSRKRKKKTLAELLEEALVPEEEQPYQVPDNWVWVRLGALLPEMETRDPTKLGTDFFTYIDVESIDNKNQKVSSPKTLSVKKAPSRAKRAVHEGDVIISLVRPYLKNIAYIGSDLKDAVASTAFYVCGPSKAHCNKYLYYYSKSDVMTTYLNLRAKGHNSPSVRNSDFLNTPFPLPPLPEQKRIVDRVESLLGKINEAKELIEEAKETFETRRAAILAKAFRGELTKKWREQHPDIEPADLLLAQGEEDSLEETKKSSKQKIAPPPANFPYELPKGWRWVKFGSCVENHNGKRVPVSGKERENRKGPFPYYGASGVIDSIDGYTHDGEFVLIGEDGANLISRNKPIAFLAKGKIWVNNHAHVVSCRIGILNDYLCHYINSIDLRPYVTGSAQPKLTKKMLNTIPIPLPSKEEQQEIVSLINNVFEAEKLVEENLSSLKSQLNSLTQSILNKAFRGELGTNNPEEESALELLKEVLLEQAEETIDNPKSKANRQGSLLLV